MEVDVCPIEFDSALKGSCTGRRWAKEEKNLIFDQKSGFNN